ncbi:hypothetical protein HHI36_009973 [Cryptolaemus montrouzieri]|uniref:Uncharacterized protein n=1 Tax=Cryptolaemus montrouzieri TaxID=559131 RepID=A0ABD2MHD6_9CUCU
MFPETGYKNILDNKINLKGIDDKVIEQNQTLGNDFLKENCCDLQCSNMTLSIRKIITKVKIFQNITNFDQNPEQNDESSKTRNSLICSTNSDISRGPIIVHPRCEQIIKINVANPEIKQGLVPNIQILDGVYLSSCLTEVDSNVTVVASILNTTTKPVEIIEISISLENFDDHVGSKLPKSEAKQVFSVNVNSDRLTKLKEKLKVAHLNEEEKISLIEICENYNHVF